MNRSRPPHAAALVRWLAGNRDVVFPAGTYAMRRFHNANVAPAPVTGLAPIVAPAPSG